MRTQITCRRIGTGALAFNFLAIEISELPISYHHERAYQQSIQAIRQNLFCEHVPDDFFQPNPPLPNERGIISGQGLNHQFTPDISWKLILDGVPVSTKLT